MNEIPLRLRKIRHLKDKLDGILLFSNDPNFFYFTGSTSGILYHDFSKPKILVSRLDENKSSIRKTVIKNNLFNYLPKGTIGINEKAISVNLFRKLRRRFKTRDISKELDDIRSIKTKQEISYIKKSCSISRKILSEVERKIFSYTEIQLRDKLLELTADYEVEPAFPPIVASGSNTSKPHHNATSKKIRKPVIIDFGVKYRNYHSDITRTIGSPDEKRLMKILEELYPRIRPGVKASSLEAFVRKRLGKDEKYFIHSLGHGLGIEIHEKPSLSKKSKDVLKENMVFTIEPGIYKNKGIRIENDFLLTKNSLKNLTD